MIALSAAATALSAAAIATAKPVQVFILMGQSNMLGFVEANGHIVPHFGNMQTFIVDKASHKATHGIADNGADPPVPSSYANADMNVLLKNTMDAVAAAAQDSPAGLDLVKFMDNKINLAGGLIMRMRERFLMSFEEQVYCE